VFILTVIHRFHMTSPVHFAIPKTIWMPLIVSPEDLLASPSSSPALAAYPRTSADPHTHILCFLSVWGGPKSLGVLVPCTAAIDICPFGILYISLMIDDDFF
jgi:hypothetical protein